MTDLDLFGKPINDAKAARKTPAPKGYARPPGSGPAGEFCRTCKHKRRRFTGSKVFYKCALVKPTKGAGTDILVGSPACSRFEKAEAAR